MPLLSSGSALLQAQVCVPTVRCALVAGGTAVEAMLTVRRWHHANGERSHGARQSLKLRFVAIQNLPPSFSM